jgi:CPA2 family monovalent cation:H+ antiporter-2
VVQDTLKDHAVLIGYGRVGSTVGEALARCGVPYVVIERDRRAVEALRRRKVSAISGDATRPLILGLAHPERARLLVIAMPDPYQARQVVEVARRANPAIETVVRTHGEAEQAYFEQHGVTRAVMGERELAIGMAHYSLRTLGRSEDETGAVLQSIRDAARQRRSAAKAS